MPAFGRFLPLANVRYGSVAADNGPSERRTLGDNGALLRARHLSHCWLYNRCTLNGIPERIPSKKSYQIYY